ncbi:MAG: MFS transporter [Rhodovulum sulfidophilum]|uniref:MFS transporter n=1 Tax=Rhodovulum sulfidophilum TaxID=35806 RepID=A0A2W5ND36_RHOSU|nr:MAG: MFS transporter [Rhodovulum sulfidophilum]
MLTLAAGAMGATMASPLFPIYEATWGIGHATVTLLYVAYMAGVLGGLMFLTQLTGRFGAIRMLRLGGGLLVVGLLFSALATGPLTLTPARVLVGVASGLVTSAATLGLPRLEPAAGEIAPLVASCTTMAGFGLGPMVCGLLAQFAPAPLATPYLVVLAVVGALVLGLARTPADPGLDPEAGPGTRPGLAPRLGLPAPGRVGVFLVAAFATFSAYALFSLLASLAPSFLPMILPWHGPAVSGFAIGLVLACSALAQLPARRLPPRRCLGLALCLLAIGALALALAMHFRRAEIFVLADLAIGSGHGLAFLAGMTLISLIAPGAKRAPVLSSHLCVAYLGAILPILAVGRLADGIGLAPAVIAFCATFALICSVLLGLSRRVGGLDMATDTPR